ncbi:MAG TPA: WD40 repeat domain-containing protein, partial [Gemmataceae bacterium]|nr:WD40 repeat domain-containing protein [Gemmataceae bacterium]
VVFTADGKTLIVAAEGVVHVVDAISGNEVRQMRINRLWPECLAVSNDGKILAVQLAGGELSLWDVATGRKLRGWQTDHFGLWPDEPDQVHLSGIAFAGGDKMLITTAGIFENGQHVGLWDVATGKPLHSQVGHKSAINGMALSPDGKAIASTSLDGTMRLWDPVTGLERMQVKADESKTLLCVAIAPDGKTIATGTQTSFDDRLVQLWDAANGKELRRFAKGPKSVAAVAFSHDGNALAAAGPGSTITFWDPATGQAKGQLTAKGTRWIHALSFSPDGKKLVSGHDMLGPPVDKSAPKPAVVPPQGEAWVWDLTTKTPLRKLLHGNKNVRVAAFSTDGQKVLTAYAGDSARLWQVDDGKELLHYAGHNGMVMGAALSHDGRLLATAGVRGRGIRLWEVASGEALVEFGDSTASFSTLAFSADGKFLISAGSDCCLLVWDVPTLLDKLRPLFFPAVAVSDKELETLWSDLASGDAATGLKAVRTLAAVPAQSVKFLHKKADLPAPSKEVAKLIADLGAKEFVVREKATADLLKFDKQVVPSLQRMLDDSSVEEILQRLIYVLEKMGEKPFSPAKRLREIRTVETLERIGNKEAKAILETWASQLVNSTIGSEAKGALARQK